MTHQEIIAWTDLMLSPDLDNVKLAFAMLEGMEYKWKEVCISSFLTRFVQIAMDNNVDNPSIWRLREGDEAESSVDILSVGDHISEAETIGATIFYEPRIWSNHINGRIDIPSIWYNFATHTLYTQDTVHVGDIPTILATDCELWIDITDDESHVFFNSLVVDNFHKLLHHE